jgi:phosphoserine phosphatase RsbU/P
MPLSQEKWLGSMVRSSIYWVFRWRLEILYKSYVPEIHVSEPDPCLKDFIENTTHKKHLKKSIIQKEQRMQNSQRNDRILIVDDNADIRAVMSMLLTKKGYDVFEVSSGEDALGFLNNNQCELILLDINMPYMNGFEVCSKIKSDLNTSKIPVIFLTSSVDVEDKISAFEGGAVDYIVKTIKNDELLARIKHQIRLASLMNELESTNNKLKRSEKQLKEDLVAAAVIQQTLLPRTLSLPEYLNIYSRFLPSNIVAGDLYNIITLDEEHIAIYILDVSGHGVSSAMVTVSIYQTLHSNKDYIFDLDDPLQKTYSPSRVLKKLNKEYPIERFGKYFTMTLMVLNHKTGELRYSSAGHPPPFYLSRDREIILLDKGGTITGFSTEEEFEEGLVCLKNGERVILYTDGLLDHNEDDTDSISRLAHCIRLTLDKSLPEQVDCITESMISNYDADNLKDDVSIFGFEYSIKHEGKYE